ncbi:hypothetical protein B4N89_20675 [Embleya scabrispora]|uniref:Uncharacterized protein n=1 Tax=Embleya scabrispora TaxID=159449 RepID=A0A1T3P2B2_9ACTN|nr:hypothetical protein [Embleya scabrispora]OPC83030.1 hypothetical protein B4N89_20675 [Embleya scabrispora]
MPNPYPRGLDGLAAINRNSRLLCLLCYGEPQDGDTTHSGHDIVAGIVPNECSTCRRPIVRNAD